MESEWDPIDLEILPYKETGVLTMKHIQDLVVGADIHVHTHKHIYIRTYVYVLVHMFSVQ